MRCSVIWLIAIATLISLIIISTSAVAGGLPDQNDSETKNVDNNNRPNNQDKPNRLLLLLDWSAYMVSSSTL